MHVYSLAIGAVDIGEGCVSAGQCQEIGHTLCARLGERVLSWSRPTFWRVGLEVHGGSLLAQGVAVLFMLSSLPQSRPHAVCTAGLRPFGMACESLASVRRAVADGVVHLHVFHVRSVGRPERDARRRPQCSMMVDLTGGCSAAGNLAQPLRAGICNSFRVTRSPRGG